MVSEATALPTEPQPMPLHVASDTIPGTHPTSFFPFNVLHLSLLWRGVVWRPLIWTKDINNDDDAVVESDEKMTPFC